MANICPKCGKSLDSGMKFCTNCGASMTNAKTDVEDLNDTLAEAKAKLSIPSADLGDVPAPTLTLDAPVFTAPTPAPAPEAAPAPAVTGSYTAPASAEHVLTAPASSPATKPAKAEKPAKLTRAEKKALAAEEAKNAKVISTAGYFFLMLLFAIPVVGWIVMIMLALWCKNPVLKNYCRAKLTWLLIGLIILIALAIAFLIISNSLIKAVNAGMGMDFKNIGELVQKVDPGVILKYLEGLFVK